MTSGSTGCSTAAWLTTGQVARKLGMSQRAVQDNVKRGAIPASKIGNGRARIPKEWLTNHLAPIEVIRRKK